MASIYKRNGTYYVKYYHNGKACRKSLQTTNRDVAKKLLRKIEDELDMVKAGMIDKPIDPAQAFKSFLEMKSRTIKPQIVTRYKQLWSNVETFLLERQIDYLNELSSAMVSEYISWRKAAPKTVQEELRILKAVLNWLVEEGDLRISPVTKWERLKTLPKEPDKAGGYSRSEVDKILEYFKDHPAGPSIHFLAYTGARRGEMESVKVKDIDLVAGTIKLLSEKTATNPSNQFRIVEVHDQLRPVLVKAVSGKKPEDHVFPDTNSHRPAWLTQLLETACRKIGIQYRRIHGLRHFWITSMLTAGTPVAIVMKMCGHNNISTTMKYLHIGNEHRGWINKI